MTNPVGLAEAITTIATLAQQASSSSVGTIPINGLGLGPGLPEIIPVAIKQGEQPKSIRSLVEEWRQQPARWRGTSTVTTLESFIELVKRHQLMDGSAIFARTSWPKPSLTAIIDYDGENGEPLHREHRIHYPFPVTDEFAAWIKFNGEKLEQREFAEFLEDRAAELAAPTEDEIKALGDLFRTPVATPTEMLDLSRGLSVNVNMKVARSERLQSGEGQIAFTEEHTNAAGDPIVVPGVFIVALPVFLDGAPALPPRRRAGHLDLHALPLGAAAARPREGRPATRGRGNQRGNLRGRSGVGPITRSSKKAAQDLRRPFRQINQAFFGSNQMTSISDILDEREKTHGNFEKTAALSQGLKQTLFSAGLMATPVMCEALDMITSKLARIVSGDPTNADHWRDIAGYAELVVRSLSGKKEQGPA